MQLVLQVICRRADAHKEQAAFQTADEDRALAELDSNSDRPDGMSGRRPRRVGWIGRVALAAVLVEIVVVVAAVGASGGADDGIGRARSGQG